MTSIRTWFERFPAPEIQRQEMIRFASVDRLSVLHWDGEISVDEFTDALKWRGEEFIHKVRDKNYVRNRGPKKPWVEPKEKAWFGLPKLAGIERHREGK